jgi:hypothetical protein
MYDPKDERGVPISGGIPLIVRIAILFGLLMIIVMMGIVIYGSSTNHRWPSSATLKEPL